jgi:competence protein ComEC
MLVPYSFSLGIFFIGFWASLPKTFWLLGFLLCALFLSLLRQKVMACFLLGMCYGIAWGQYTLSHQLPEMLNPTEFLVLGQVVGLPSVKKDSVRFHLRLMDDWDSDRINFKEIKREPLKTIRLSWYNNPPELEPGQIWRLKIKLRRPRGMVNPGGFDYQAWLIRQGISATGYVRSGNENQLIAHQSSFDLWRFHLRKSIEKLPLSDQVKSLLIALTLGDRSIISSDLWDTLVLSGVVHLMVISGLHIGLVATFSYAIGAGIARLLSLLNFSVTAGYWGSTFSFLASVIYAALAGCSLPTPRALIMILVVIVSVLVDRKVSRGWGFGLALAGVAIIDPLAFSGVGFWLSFGAVACLLWLIPVVLSAPFWKRYAQVQCLVFVSLLVPLIGYQLPISWVSPLINMVAIPWVSLLVVPLCLLATVVFPFYLDGAAGLWTLAGWFLDYFIHFIQIVPELGGPSVFGDSFTIEKLPHYVSLPMTRSVVFTLALGFILIILPRGIPAKFLSIPLIGGLILMPHNHRSPLMVSVLDVGQGLSVVVQTKDHSLVYDTGPGRQNGFNTGKAVVAPYLRYQGIKSLDMLIVSHSDNDHAGGAASLVASFRPLQILLGEKIELDLGSSIKNQEVSESFCSTGKSWVWDDVDFQFLFPYQGSEKDGIDDGLGHSNNNRSCVLQIQYKDQVIILPGDIEAVVEHQLLSDKKIAYPITLLVAPHHGSKTSSTPNFVSTLKPEHVVFSSGYKHHFGHPAATVVARYQREESVLWQTSEHGAIEFIWNERGALDAVASRIERKRYWY